MIIISKAKMQFGEDQIAYKGMQFNDNESYIILGASGSGKSTLLNVIDGTLKLSEGTVEVDSKDLSKLSEKELQNYRRQEVSYVSQISQLFEDLTIKDNFDVICKIAGIKKTVAEYNELLKEVGLAGKLNRRVKTLSGGEKQRVNIAIGLMKKTPYMLCDEPTSALNYELAEGVMSCLMKAHEVLKNTLIVVTHDARLSKFFDNEFREDAWLDSVATDEKGGAEL